MACQPGHAPTGSRGVAQLLGDLHTSAGKAKHLSDEDIVQWLAMRAHAREAAAKATEGSTASGSCGADASAASQSLEGDEGC